ncbi:MAG: peptidase T [Prevotella sp.]|nr:peptidase T [Prevotella sp.]
MNLTERFLNYTRFDTQSAEDAATTPSTPEKQLRFARYLRDELVREGLSDVELDDNGYIYATLKSNIQDRHVPIIGFIAHYDTSPDCSGFNVNPRIINNYDGGDIVLSEGVISSPKTFPELLEHKGEDLIVTDGTTLLGADDKAGIAEIVEAMCFLRDRSEIPHGEIRIAFNPDEEIGRGSKLFDVDKFGCAWAYTMDGGDLGELEYENFNAAAAKITIRGVSVHTGYAKGKMINASRVAAELFNALPEDEAPERTEGREGFYHLVSQTSTTEQAAMYIIIRDHDRDRFEARKKYMHQCVDELNNKYGAGTVTANIYDQYYNMKEIIDRHPYTIDICLEAFRRCGIKAKVQPIRGGTDGAQLSFRGLPCPNIFAGGVNFHGRHEFVSIQVMEKAMAVIVEICKAIGEANLLNNK